MATCAAAVEAPISLKEQNSYQQAAAITLLEDQENVPQIANLCADFNRLPIVPQTNKVVLASEEPKELHKPEGVSVSRGRGRGRGKIPLGGNARCESELGQSSVLATSETAIEAQLEAHKRLKELNISQETAGGVCLEDRKAPQQFATISSFELALARAGNARRESELGQSSVLATSKTAIEVQPEGVSVGRGRGRGKIPPGGNARRESELGQLSVLATSKTAIEVQLEAHKGLKEPNVSKEAAGGVSLEDRKAPQQFAVTSRSELARAIAGNARRESELGQSSVIATGVSLVDRKAATTSSESAIDFVEPDVHSDIEPLFKKQGTSGKRIKLLCNYFKVTDRPKWTIYQYHVYFDPDTDDTRLRRAYLDEHRDKIDGFIFDGSTLYCTKLFDDEVFVTQTRSNETIHIMLRLTLTVEAPDEHQIQVLNLILRRAMEGLKLEQISRNYYDPQTKISLENYRLELWPGYITSIRQHERDILLCAEITHKVMRTETLLDIYKQCQRDKKGREYFSNQVKGKLVLTDYNNKTYRIDDVDFKLTPRSTFPTTDGDISFMSYYKKRYNITIRELNQPLLKAKSKTKFKNQDQDILLIPELARATGLTDAMLANTQLMKQMGEHTRMAPKRRIQSLRTFNKRLLSTKQSMQLLESWNLTLDKNLLEIPARILPSESIQLANNFAYLCDAKADWTRELRHGMHSTVAIKRWSVIYTIPNRSGSQEFVKLCMQAAQQMNMLISKPDCYEIADDDEYTIHRTIKEAALKDPQIIMIILKQPNEAKYAVIKKLTCVTRPVPTQVVTSKTLAPRKGRNGCSPAIATKVVIQLNAKLGGVPWKVAIPLPGLMVIGFDVYAPRNNRNTTYGAFVATVDTENSTSKYFSIVHEMSKDESLTKKMSISIQRALEAYKDCNGALPNKVVFYRDGLGEGRLESIEFQTMTDTLSQYYKTAGRGQMCQMAFIVVTKKINTRLMFNDSNPPPGTVVDSVITLGNKKDFYLVPQSVNQGTVSPTCYNIVYSNMGITVDKFQILSYKMCHLYYNWCGTVRVPAVCQYAHKLSFLVAESIKEIPAAGLSNQLYFL